MDSAGNVYIVDSVAGLVEKVPAGGGAKTTVARGPELASPDNVAVDSAGNVYIYDSGHQRIVKVPAGAGAPTTVVSGLTTRSMLSGLAVDSAGTIYIGDPDNNTVVQVPAGGGPRTTVARGLALPLGGSIAVDRAGNVYIVDGHRVIEELLGRTQPGNGSHDGPPPGQSPTALPRGVRPPQPALPDVSAVGVSAGEGGKATVVYVASSAGVFRAQAPFSSWEKRSTAGNVTALSPRPGAANDLVLDDGANMYRSTDGGHTEKMVAKGRAVTRFARSRSAPGTIFGAGDDGATTLYIYRSTDDGRTWTTVYTAGDTNGETDRCPSPISAISESTPARVIVAADFYHDGRVIVSSDGGNTWHDAVHDLSAPAAVAINPGKASELWAGWSEENQGFLGHSRDGGKTWTEVSAGLPLHMAVNGLAYDVLTDRLYVEGTTVDAEGDSVPGEVYASADGTHFARFAPGAQGVGSLLAIDAHDGYLLAGDSDNPLLVRRLIGPQNWAILPTFAPYYATHNGPHLLGQPIGPATRCAGLPCQYFEKGRLEDHSALTTRPTWRISYGPLIARVASHAGVGAGGGRHVHGDLQVTARTRWSRPPRATARGFPRRRGPGRRRGLYPGLRHARAGAGLHRAGLFLAGDDEPWPGARWLAARHWSAPHAGHGGHGDERESGPAVHYRAGFSGCYPDRRCPQCTAMAGGARQYR